MTEFVHLHVHTMYSPLDGMIMTRELFEAAEMFDMKAVAITDHGTTKGWAEFLSDAKNHPYVKPIFGCEFYLSTPASARLYHVLMLAKNQKGLRNILRLEKMSRTNVINRRPALERWMIEEFHEGIICTSACIGGELAQAIINNPEDLQYQMAVAQWYKDLFGDDFYVELDLHQNTVEDRIWPLQQVVVPQLYRVAKKAGIKVVAANDVHYMTSFDAGIHDEIMARNCGWKVDDPRRLRFTGEEWFKSTETMTAIFADCPQAIANTIEIADKVEDMSYLETEDVKQL